MGFNQKVIASAAREDRLEVPCFADYPSWILYSTDVRLI